MTDRKIKEIDYKKVLKLENLIQYQDLKVIKKTLLENSGARMTLFSLDKDQSIPTHSSQGDAFVYIIDGKADITIDEEKFEIFKGETIVIPSGSPHSLHAIEKFKMLLIVGM